MQRHTCPTCGQATTEDESAAEHRGECPKCSAARYGGTERHETVRLFEPAPEQIPGQLAL